MLYAFGVSSLLAEAGSHLSAQFFRLSSPGLRGAMATVNDRSARPVPLTAHGYDYDKVPAVAAIALPTPLTLRRRRGDWQRLPGIWLIG